MKQYDIFISYSRKDLNFAEEMCAILDEYKKHYKFEYFFDREDIKSKHDYLVRIADAISESKTVLFLASKYSLSSEFCLKELLFADKEHVRIHQYRIDDCEYPKPILLLLGNHHYREASSFSKNDMIREVLENVLDIKPKEIPCKNDNCTSYKLLRFVIPILFLFLIVWGVFKLSTNYIVHHYQHGLEQEINVEQKVEYERKLVEELEKMHPNDLSKLEQEDSSHQAIEINMLENKLQTLKVENERLVSEVKNAKEEETIYRLCGNGNNGIFKVGYYYNDGIKEGVVFEVDATGKHGKILSMLQSEKKIQWASNETEWSLHIGTLNEIDGEENMKTVKMRPNWRTNYPAFAWCADLGDNWYLPAIKELNIFNPYRIDIDGAISETISNTLRDKGFKSVVLYDYWSSTECSETLRYANCYYARMGGWSSGYSKKGHLYVRAVSKF